ncbi:MAG: hypothetical protein HDS45_03345 [Bacteroides sp.]|nr:hypothetical protein [Bacteroides sp.]
MTEELIESLHISVLDGIRGDSPLPTQPAEQVASPLTGHSILQPAEQVA